MKALRQLGKAKEHLKRGLFARAQHTGAHGESTSGRTPSESFHKATSRVPWGTLTATGFTFTGFGWGLNSLSQSESFKNIDLSDLWKAPAIANSLVGHPSWLSGWSVGGGMGPNSLADAAAKAMPAVVNIHCAPASDEGRGEHRSCGSGFLVESSGLVATNAHVVEAALEEQAGRKGVSKTPLRVSLQDGRCFDGEVVSIDRVSDLALVKIDTPSPLPTVKMGSSRGMRVGEWVLALGSPLTLQNSVTAGIVSCVGRQAKELGIAGNTGFIQTDAEIGSSGGPLVNLAGEVVGISTMKALFSAGVSFAIPIDTAREVLEQMQRQGRVVRPYIGIKLLELNERNTSQMHQRYSRFPTRSSGLLVPHVLAGSPASKAGLKQGDIIIGFGNSKDVSVPALVEALTHHVGKDLPLHVLREEKELHLSVRAIEARNDYPEVQ